MKMTIGCTLGNFRFVAAAAFVAAGWVNCAVADQSPRTVDASPARASSAVPDMAAVNERRAIMLEVEKLRESGASPEQISEWHEKNAARVASNEQKLVDMSARQDSVPQPYIREIQIPPGASETMKTFLRERAKLTNEQILIHNQTLQASPGKRSEALEAWQKKNAAALEAQATRASQIGAESQPLALRPSTSADIPRNATPDLRDFLTQRNAQIKAETEVIARLKTATPEQRQQALEAWRADNPVPVRAMQDAAARLSNESK